MMRNSGNGSNFNPTLDAGLGLIFRLNYLWNKSDRHALAGEMDQWNFTLDRIFSNLSYRGEMDIIYEDPKERDATKKKIIDIRLNLHDKQVHEKLRMMLRDIKVRRQLALKKRDKKVWDETREEEYDLMMKKDIWLRKMMQIQKLYIKESEFDAAKAMWGG